MLTSFISRILVINFSYESATSVSSLRFTLWQEFYNTIRNPFGAKKKCDNLLFFIFVHFVHLPDNVQSRCFAEPFHRCDALRSASFLERHCNFVSFLFHSSNYFFARLSSKYALFEFFSCRVTTSKSFG